MRLQVTDLEQRDHAVSRYMLRSCGSRRMRSQSPISALPIPPSRCTARKHGQPPVADHQHRAAIRQHRAPGRLGRRHADAEETQASAMMTTPIVRLASTIAEFKTFGSARQDHPGAQPAISANLTYSRSRRLNTSPRITRAYRVQ